MKHPGTAGLMPVKGTTCGLRPDLDEMGADTGFDFSEAESLLPEEDKPAEASTALKGSQKNLQDEPTKPFTSK